MSIKITEKERATLRKWCSKIGRLGGAATLGVTSKAKKKSSRANIQKAIAARRAKYLMRKHAEELAKTLKKVEAA